MVKKYGLPMLVTSDEGLKEYIQTILSQVSGECRLPDMWPCADAVLLLAIVHAATHRLLSPTVLHPATTPHALASPIHPILSHHSPLTPRSRPLHELAELAHTDWLLSSTLTRLVLAIKSVETDETLERWQFDIHTEDGPTSAGAMPGAPKPTKKHNKTEKEVQGEIREIMKQITSSVTFLPILDDECESCAEVGCCLGGEGGCWASCELRRIAGAMAD